MSKQMSSLREFGGFHLDVKKKILRHGDEAIDVPLKEIELLCLLTEGRELVTKEEIWQRVWGNQMVEETNLTSKIYRLRKLFEKYGESPDWIQTVPRRGYRFTAQVIYHSNNSETIIERRSISKTVIEEISHQPNQLLPSEKNSNRYWLAAIIGLILVGSVVGYYFLSQKFGKTEKIQSIAVLPLKSFAPKTIDDALRLRVMDSISTKLGTIESISVRPTSSMVQFLETNESAIEIGKKLLVDAVLEGSIQREDNKLRITMQLVSVKTATQIWSEQFDGEADKLLDLQNLVSAKLIAELNLRLSKEQEKTFAKRPTSNSEAFEEYLKGRYFWNKRTPDGLKSAITSFEKAIKLDPNFSLAYSGLADVYCVLPEYTISPEKDSYQLAQTNAKRALELDPNLAEAFASLAFVEFWNNKNFAESEKNFRRAIAAKPNYPTAHQWFANVLLARKNLAPAIEQMSEAQKLDPLSLVINTELGILYYYSRQYETAVTQLRRTLEIEPKFYRASLWLARVLTVQGKFEEAFSLYQNLPQDVAEQEGIISEIGYTNGLAKNQAKAETLLKTLQSRSAVEKNAFSSAMILLGLGKNDESIRYLTKAAQERESDLAYIDLDPIFDSLRENQEFKTLAERFR